MCSLGPLGDGAVVLPRARSEVLGACLVDGPRREHARALRSAEIVRAAVRIADGLAAAKWSPWAQVIRRAIADAHDGWPSVEAAGQALEAVRAFGPMASELEPPDATVTAQGALEVLVTSSGLYWLDCRELHAQRNM